MPPLPLMLPAKVWLLPSPKARLLAPRATVVPAVPARPPTVRLPSAAAMSKTAPGLARARTPVGARLPAPASASVPAFTVVPPAKAFTPVNVCVPAPCFTMPPLPVIVPAKVWLVPLPKPSVFAPSVTVDPDAPDSAATVRLPSAVAMSKPVPAPARFTLLPAARLPAPDSASVPPAMVVVPV